MEAEHHHRAAITANVNMAAGVFVRRGFLPPRLLILVIGGHLYTRCIKRSFCAAGS